MPQTITIVIDKTSAIKRFEQAAWKMGRMLEQPNSVKQVWNLQADHEETADNGLMTASFEQHLWEGVYIISEYLSSQPSYGTSTHANEFTITLSMPSHWVIHSAPGLKYEMLELVQNGMMADWLDEMKPDQAKAYRQQTELCKAKIQSIIYALNAP